MSRTSTALHDLLDAAAAERPGSPAIGHGGTTLTFAELDAASRQVAGWLAGLGVARGDRVVVSLPTGPSIPALIYGCSRAGAVFCLINEQAPAAVLAHVLDDCAPALLISDAPDAAGLAASRGLRHAGSAEPLAGNGSAPLLSWTPLSVDPACLIYTSGSTDRPKAVVCTHGQMVFAATAIHSQLGYRADDVVYCALPLSFDYGMYQVLLGTLGRCLVQLGSANDAGPLLLRRLHDSGATVLPAVPGLALGLARMLSRPGARPLRLRLLTNTGAAMRPDVLGDLRARIPGLRVQLMFGLTECKRATIMPPDEDLRRPDACGRALPGTEILIVDRDGSRLPPGEIGEIVVRGPNVMAGYWRRPNLTAQRFPRAEGLFPQLCTGDYGRLDDDGYLYFVGRRDDIYKERGFRVSATEVEAAAHRVAGVEAAAVLPPADAADGATLFVVSSRPPHEVLAGLRAELEEGKAPRVCHTVPDIPLTSNGKIDRAGLRRLLREGSLV